MNGRARTKGDGDEYRRGAIINAAIRIVPHSGLRIRRFPQKREFPDNPDGGERKHDKGSGRFQAKHGGFQEKLLSACGKAPNT